MSFKPTATKISGVEFNINGLPVRILGDNVAINEAGIIKQISIKTLVSTAEAIKALDKKYNFYCLEHGWFMANKGERQKPGCTSCVQKLQNDTANSGDTDDDE